MRIAILIAGTNEPSNSAALAAAFTEGIRTTAPDAHIACLRLNDLHIEHFTLARYSSTCVTKDDFCRLQELVQTADGVVIATPIWNFSVPAHLKNVIDRMGAFALDQETHSRGQLRGKPFALIFTGGAPMIAWKALMYLTTLHVPEAIKYYDGAVVSRHYEPQCMPARGAFGLVVDRRPLSLAAMRRAGARFADTVAYYARTGSLPIRRRIIRRYFTTLYRIGNRIMYPLHT